MSREYRFDRYRKGRKMAEGLVLTHPKTVDDAVAVASRLAEAGDVFVLCEDLACLAAVEAERDAARAEVERLKREIQAEEDNCPYPDFSCGTFAAQRGIELRPAGGPTYTTTIEHWQGLLGELKTVQGGEARAVEALRRCHEGAARQLAEPRDHDDDQYALTAIATDCEAALADSANALDWLAQQRREAAVEALEKLATDLGKVPWGSALHDVDWLRGILRTRAAEIRAGEVGDE